MGTERNNLAEDDYFYANKAFMEFKESGHTDKKCPICNGTFIFEDKKSAYIITCDSCDFKLTARGI